MAVKTFNTGRVGNKHRGTWSNLEQYIFMDTVISSDGSVYLNTSTTGTPIGTPPENNGYWMLYVPNAAYSIGSELEALNGRVASLENNINSLVTPPNIIEFPISPTITYTGNRGWYCKDGTGMVTVGIRFDSITMLSIVSQVATLPEGYRPQRTIFNVAMFTRNITREVADWQVNTDGGVIIRVNNIGLNEWYTSQMQYPAA